MTIHFFHLSAIKYSEVIDYKNIYLLRKFINIQGKILPRRLTNLNSKQYRFIVNSL
jgi:ribosomal protein S18